VVKIDKSPRGFSAPGQAENPLKRVSAAMATDDAMSPVQAKCGTTSLFGIGLGVHRIIVSSDLLQQQGILALMRVMAIGATPGLNFAGVFL
jgi:hypothetical protein